jgi:hypothetical protein
MGDGCKNTDRELWREPDKDGKGDFYSDSVHVTQEGGIGINVGGLVFVKSLAEWHKLARENSTHPNSVFTQKDANNG